MSGDLRQPDTDQRDSGESLVPEIVATGEYDPFTQGPAAPYEPRAPGSGGREFSRGGVRVYGCSRNCLITCLLISFILTLLLNAIF